MIGLDTSAIIDLFKKDTSLIKFLEKIDNKIALNQISYSKKSTISPSFTEFEKVASPKG